MSTSTTRGGKKDEKKPETQLAETPKNTSMAVMDYGEDEGAGHENLGKDDFAIPFLLLLQPLSPPVVEGRAKAGDLYNTLTEEVIPGSEGVRLVPVLTQHVYTRWVPRDAGGGFRGQHDPASPEVKEAQKQSGKVFGKLTIVAPNEKGEQEKNEMVETFYLYAQLLDKNLQPAGGCIINFYSTKIKLYKQMMTKIAEVRVQAPDGRKVKPPLFAHPLHLTTVSQKNNKGTFYNFVIRPVKGSVMESLLAPDHAAVQAGSALLKLIQSGDAKVDFEKQQAPSTDEGEVTDGNGKEPF